MILSILITVLIIGIFSWLLVVGGKKNDEPQNE